MALTYGAATSTGQPYASRITVLLDADTDLTLEYLDDIEVGTHPDQVLEDCRLLFGG